MPGEDEAVAPAKGSSDRAVMDRLSISLNPKIFANRIQLIKSLEQLKDVSPFVEIWPCNLGHAPHLLFFHDVFRNYYMTCQWYGP